MYLVKSNPLRTFDKVPVHWLQRRTVHQKPQSFSEVWRNSHYKGEHVGLNTGTVTRGSKQGRVDPYAAAQQFSVKEVESGL